MNAVTQPIKAIKSSIPIIWLGKIDFTAFISKDLRIEWSMASLLDQMDDENLLFIL